VAFGPNPNPTYLVLAVIEQGGCGAQAAAPLVRNIFDYIAANPALDGAVKTPTPASPPSQTAPAANPPLGTPTTVPNSGATGASGTTTSTTAGGG
jgi:hypothetical protein